MQFQLMTFTCPGYSAGREEEVSAAGEALGKTTEEVTDSCPSRSRTGILDGRGDWGSGMAFGEFQVSSMTI